MHELHKTLNENLNSFLEAFNGMILKEIDWNRPYEVVDHEYHINNLTNENNKDPEYVYTVKAWNTKGENIIFGIQIIIGREKDDLKIGFTEIKILEDLPDESDSTDDDDTDDEDALAREYLIKLTAKLKANKERQGPDYGKRCTSCGRDDLNLNILVNAELGETQYLCAVCISKNQNKAHERKLVDIEKEITETEKMIANMEEIISTVEMPSMPKELERFAVTPLSLYKSFQAILANLKSERMEILSGMDTIEKLNVLLERAIENEDFEQSAILRDKLSNLKD